MKRVLVWFVFLLGVTCIASAQRITITPTIGAFVPAKDLDRWSVPYPPCDVTPCDVEFQTALEPGVALGVRAATRLIGSFGIEVSVVTTATQRLLRFDPEENPFGPESQSAARHSVAAVRATVERPLGSIAILGFAVGASRTKLSGEALVSFQSPVDTLAPPVDTEAWGASFAASVGFVLSRRAHAHFSIADNVYSWESVAGGGSGYVQHDFQLAMGLSVILVK